MMPAVPPLGAPGDLPVSPARAPILASPDTYRKLAAVWVSFLFSFYFVFVFPCLAPSSSLTLDEIYYFIEVYS